VPIIADETVESMVRNEAARIIEVSEDRDHISQYTIFLSDFPRRDILGMSVGGRRIYISYELASRALADMRYRWVLRQTIAHEIGHENAGHATQGGGNWFNNGKFTFGASGREVGLPWYVRVYNYPVEKELEADLEGLSYWSKLGWDCRIWVDILKQFQEQNYVGDSFHPTDSRLQQAQNVCQREADSKSRNVN
jgi:predicted Zn-dependent protease